MKTRIHCLCVFQNRRSRGCQCNTEMMPQVYKVSRSQLSKQGKCLFGQHGSRCTAATSYFSFVCIQSRILYQEFRNPPCLILLKRFFCDYVVHARYCRSWYCGVLLLLLGGVLLLLVTYKQCWPSVYNLATPYRHPLKGCFKKTAGWVTNDSDFIATPLFH